MDLKPSPRMVKALAQAPVMPASLALSLDSQVMSHPGVQRPAQLTAQQQAVLAAVPRWKRTWTRPSYLKSGQKPSYKVMKWVLDDGSARDEIEVARNDDSSSTTAPISATNGVAPGDGKMGHSQATDEEMAAALQIVVEGGADLGAINAGDASSTSAQPSRAVSEAMVVVETPETTKDSSVSTPTTMAAATEALSALPLPEAAATSASPAPTQPSPLTTSVPTQGPSLEKELDPQGPVVPTDADKPATGPPPAIAPDPQHLEGQMQVQEAVRQVPSPSAVPEPAAAIPGDVEMSSAADEVTGGSAESVAAEASDASAVAIQSGKPEQKSEFVEDEIQLAQEATQGMVGMSEPDLTDKAQ